MTEIASSEITIRRIQPHKSSLYRSTRLACHKNDPENFGSTYEEESSMPKLKFEFYIEQGLEDHFMFGAFDNEKLIGIVGFDRMDRRRACHRGEVVQMYVDASYRGQNIGERLLRNLIEDAFLVNGIEQLQLSVIAGNQSAINLYEKIGFRTFGLQLKYFKIGDRYTDQQFMQLLNDDYQNKN